MQGTSKLLVQAQGMWSCSACRRPTRFLDPQTITDMIELAEFFCSLEKEEKEKSNLIFDFSHKSKVPRTSIKKRKKNDEP